MYHRYKHYRIDAFAVSAVSTGKYLPQAVISWEDRDGNKVEQTLTFATPCLTSMYATAVALDEAKVWIDQRLDNP
jgi:hypothetical protein